MMMARLVWPCVSPPFLSVSCLLSFDFRCIYSLPLLCEMHISIATAILGQLCHFQPETLSGVHNLGKHYRLESPPRAPLAPQFPKRRSKVEGRKTHSTFLNGYNTNQIHLWCIRRLSIALFVLI